MEWIASIPKINGGIPDPVCRVGLDFLLHPEHEYTLTALAKRLDVPLTTLQREAQRLVVAGLLQDRALGRARLLRANMSNRAAAPLTKLLEVTFPVIWAPEQWANDGDSLVLQIKASLTVDVTQRGRPRHESLAPRRGRD